MGKGKLFAILALILGAIVACFSFYGGRGWTDDDCHAAFDGLYWHYAHEESGWDWFTVPDFWSGTHGYVDIGGRLLDPETLLDKLEANCSHLYSVEYAAAGTTVRRLEYSNPQPELQPAYATASYSTVLWVAIAIFIVFILGILLRSRGLSPV